MKSVVRLVSSWKDKLSQRCIQSLGVDMHSPICRACRDDVSRLVKNPAFTPRWAKEKQKENCIIQTCTGIDLHYSTTISGDELTELGFDIPNIIVFHRDVLLLWNVFAVLNLNAKSLTVRWLIEKQPS